MFAMIRKEFLTADPAYRRASGGNSFYKQSSEIMHFKITYEPRLQIAFEANQYPQRLCRYEYNSAEMVTGGRKISHF
jgi:hypothetical protein